MHPMPESRSILTSRSANRYSNTIRGRVAHRIVKVPSENATDMMPTCGVNKASPVPDAEVLRSAK